MKDEWLDRAHPILTALPFLPPPPLLPGPEPLCYALTFPYPYKSPRVLTSEPTDGTVGDDQRDLKLLGSRVLRDCLFSPPPPLLLLLLLLLPPLCTAGAQLVSIFSLIKFTPPESAVQKTLFVKAGAASAPEARLQAFLLLRAVLPLLFLLLLLPRSLSPLSQTKRVKQGIPGGPPAAIAVALPLWLHVSC